VADAGVLGILGARSFTETFGHLYTPQNLAAFLQCHAPESWTGELTDPRFAVRLGEVAGEAVAYAKLGPAKLPFTPPEGAIELKQFYVLTPWHGAGVAAEMMDWVLAESRRRGAAELYLSVFVDNHRAQAFYARYGFERVGAYAFMVGDHEDEDHVMRLAL
jgi:ribosomal protein S18 acetylase RimI-like enzyme